MEEGKDAARNARSIDEIPLAAQNPDSDEF